MADLATLKLLLKTAFISALKAYASSLKFDKKYTYADFIKDNIADIIDVNDLGGILNTNKAFRSHPKTNDALTNSNITKLVNGALEDLAVKSLRSQILLANLPKEETSQNTNILSGETPIQKDETTTSSNLTPKLQSEEKIIDATPINTSTAEENKSINEIVFDGDTSDLDSDEEKEAKKQAAKEGAKEWLGLSEHLLELLKMFYSWWELVQTLKNSSDTFLETKIQAKDTGNGDNTVNINCAVNVKSALDKFGRTLKEGLVCPECGKHVASLKTGGFCSTECALTYTAKKIAPFALAPNDKYKDFLKCLNDLIAILDLTTLVINAIITIPNIIGELAVLPEKYRNWVNLKINEGFCYLYQCIQKLMMKKNELIKMLMKQIKMGWIAKPILFVFTAIQAVTEALEQLLAGFDIAYNAVMSALSGLKATGLCIPGDGMAIMCSPRSYSSPFPVVSPDAGMIFVNLLNGSGLYNIKLTILPSHLQNLNFSGIDAAIQASFPPLTPVDYYLEPELFEIRYLFSDQSDLVLLVRQQLEDLLTAGPDYLPKWENMIPLKKFTYTIVGQTFDIWLPNLGYANFLIGLADSWAPHSKAVFGSILNPTV